MEFRVISSRARDTFGDLFFSVPTKEESDRAAEQVEALCRIEIENKELYNEVHIKRLEEELILMKETESAYHFLLLKEINGLSDKEIDLRGPAEGSIISKLLGLTKIDILDPILVENHLSTPIEFAWGLPGNHHIPIFEAHIEPKIRSKIHCRLDKCYGRVDADYDLFRRISLPDRMNWLEVNTASQLMEEKYLAVLHAFAEDKVEWLKKLLEEHAISEKVYYNSLNLTEEMLKMTSCDLLTLVRLFAYILGNFHAKRTIHNLQDPWFFTTREEFYAILLSIGMPKEEALHMVKKGILLCRGKRREHYTQILQSYGAPEPFMEYYSKTDNLWSAASILNMIYNLL